MEFQSLPIVVRSIQEEDLPDILAVYRQSQDFLALGPDPIASLEMVQGDIENSRRKRRAAGYHHHLSIKERTLH